MYGTLDLEFFCNDQQGSFSSTWKFKKFEERSSTDDCGIFRYVSVKKTLKSKSCRFELETLEFDLKILDSSRLNNMPVDSSIKWT